MARTNDINWDDVHLSPGGFWHSKGDGAQVLIGFGTRKGNKFVQQDATQIRTLLAAIPALLAGTGGVKDDQRLQDIADMIEARYPADGVTFEEVLNDPDGLGARYFELAQGGMGRDDVLAQLTVERRAPKVKALAKAG